MKINLFVYFKVLLNGDWKYNPVSSGVWWWKFHTGWVFIYYLIA